MDHKQAQEIADRILDRIERDKGIHRSSIAEEVGIGLTRLAAIGTNADDKWRITPELYREFQKFMRDRVMSGTFLTGHDRS